LREGGGQVALHISIGRSTAVDLDQNSHSSPVYSLYSIFGVGSSWAKNNRDDIVRSAGIGGIRILLLYASNRSEKPKNCNCQLLQRRTVLPRNSKGDESNVSVAHASAPRHGIPSTGCAAIIRSTAWSPCASAPAWAQQEYLRRFKCCFDFAVG
jgi:hypothetical protein